MSQKNYTKQRIQVENFEILFDLVGIQQCINSIDSRLAKVERQIKEINGENKNE